MLGKPIGEPAEAVARMLPESDTRRVFDMATKRFWYHAWWWVPQAIVRGGVVEVHAAIEVEAPRTETGGEEPRRRAERCPGMAMRLFLVYVLVELAVVVALVSTIGFGWTFLLVAGTFALGLVLAGSQVKRQIERLRTGLSSPQGAVSDGALVALGSVLTVVPGLVTSVLGLLLLLPPTRAAARPVVGILAARSIGRMPLIVTTTTSGSPYRRTRGEYVDGEVLDVTDSAGTEPPSLPTHPDVA